MIADCGDLPQKAAASVKAAAANVDWKGTRRTRGSSQPRAAPKPELASSFWGMQQRRRLNCWQSTPSTRVFALQRVWCDPSVVQLRHIPYRHKNLQCFARARDAEQSFCSSSLLVTCVRVFSNPSNKGCIGNNTLEVTDVSCIRRMCHAGYSRRVPLCMHATRA
jgi:hypothetical protein